MSKVTARTAQLSTTRPKADSYLEIGFAASAGPLLAGANTGWIRTRCNKTDWSNYSESNDYSYGPSLTPTVSTRLTLYYEGALVWSVEP